MRRGVRSLLIFAAAIGAVRLVKARGAGSGSPLATDQPDDRTQRWDSPNASSAYDTDCPPSTVSPHCAALRGAVIYELVSALDQLSDNPTAEEAQIALGALDVKEPEVKSAALSLIGSQHELPGAGPKVLDILLTNPYEDLQAKAARVLTSMESEPMQRVGRQWEMNHPNLSSAGSPATPAVRTRVAAVVVPRAVAVDPYPGARRFAPSESDRSVGFTTHDSVDKVVAFYSKKLGKPLDAEAWTKWLADHQSAYYPTTNPFDDPEYKRISEQAQKFGVLAQRLSAAKDAKTRDQIQAEITALQAKIQRDTAAFAAKQPVREERPGVVAIQTPPPGDVPQHSVRVFVGAEQHRRALRTLAIYREDAVDGTVIQLAWDPAMLAPAAK